MARAGLGPSWTCVFANDFDEKKAATYESNWGEGDFKSGDVGVLSTEDLPGRADLVWASFPCQDLSLAGKGAGLNGARSGTFWPFWRLMKQLRTERRPPRIIAIENVCGTLTSNGRKDFAALVKALADSNYHFGALVIDAVHFLPQSRPRLFIVAVDEDARVPEHLMRPEPDATWSPDSLIEAHGRLTKDQRSRWVWWALPAPPARKTGLSKLIEKDPKGVAWHTKAETKRLLDLMSPLNRKKVEAKRSSERQVVGTIYRRTRSDETGTRVQRAEIRFDDIAGCLRTPVGGSSRQCLMFVEGDSTRSRLLSPREAARLMGLPETYRLPEKYNDAYHLAGDGVAVPVVRHLAAYLLEPLLAAIRSEKGEAA